MRYDAASVGNLPEISKQLSVSSSRVLSPNTRWCCVMSLKNRILNIPYISVSLVCGITIVNNTHQPIRNAGINCGFCDVSRSKQIGLVSDLCDRQSDPFALLANDAERVDYYLPPFRDNRLVPFATFPLGYPEMAVTNYELSCVRSQKSWSFKYTGAKAWNVARKSLSRS
jgi:hypothetical protein